MRKKVTISCVGCKRRQNITIETDIPLPEPNKKMLGSFLFTKPELAEYLHRLWNKSINDYFVCHQEVMTPNQFKQQIITQMITNFNEHTVNADQLSIFLIEMFINNKITADLQSKDRK